MPATCEFHPATRIWFEETFGQPTAIQQAGWPVIARGDHCLLLAPTGRGKTLAAFLGCLDRLTSLPDSAEPVLRVLYISPLKALVNDIERNLRVPLAGIRQAALRLGHAMRDVRVSVRTGDTDSAERRRQRREPSDILATTPESLYLLLTSAARETLRNVETVIVDEIHALAPNKRGAHLALSLERLECLTHRSFQRIGLSATVRPSSPVAHFLACNRPVTVVDTAEAPLLDIEVVVTVADMTKPQSATGGRSNPVAAGSERAGMAQSSPGSPSILKSPALQAVDRQGMWPVLLPELMNLIEQHRSTLVFVNSRGLCERLTQQLNDLGGKSWVRAHHGSVSLEQRRDIEQQLKSGALRAVVATSSLELGIDMGEIDLVIQVESPGSVSRGLQRVGRAGHGVGRRSRGRMLPKHRGDLLESVVVVERMKAGALEPLHLPQNPLDVLAQQIVAMCAVDTWHIADLERVVHRCANFANLPHRLLLSVLEMLAGRYPSQPFADLRPRLIWDGATDRLATRRDARVLALTHAGTIADRGLFVVYQATDGTRVGELDEEMVYESRVGQTFVLGSSTWRIAAIERDRVLVEPAPGEPGRMPFWHGDIAGRTVELGRAVGSLLRELAARPADAAQAWLIDSYGLDPQAALNLVDWIEEQRQAGGAVPGDRCVVFERFRDELGDWRLCLLTPFGRRVHAPWALALQGSLSARAGYDIPVLWNDDGIAWRLADGCELPDPVDLVPSADQVEAMIVEQLLHTGLFAAMFRENAARALMLPRPHARSRTPLWAQRLRAQNLLAAVRQYADFPIMLETYRTCLQDLFDLPALKTLLAAIHRNEVRVVPTVTSAASPFARSLVFAYVAAYMYQADAPAAERRAQALTLDQGLLQQLLGPESLRQLLDDSVLQAVERQLQGIDIKRQARDADALHDLLRHVGDLNDQEIRDRCVADPRAWLELLHNQRRIVSVVLAGEDRWLATEDGHLFLAAFPSAHATEPDAWLPSGSIIDSPLASWLRHWARSHVPFAASAVAQRYGLPLDTVEQALQDLVGSGQLTCGAFCPDGHTLEWSDPDVLRRLRRQSLVRARRAVAPVPSATLAAWLPRWQGIVDPLPVDANLPSAIARLEGCALSFVDLERHILPLRVAEFQPSALDALGANGSVVWVGRGALGHRDGRIALYQRHRLALLNPEPAMPSSLTSAQQEVLTALQARGASFFSELLVDGSPSDSAERLAALWELVWAGLVTNDTFLALRGRLSGPQGKGTTARGRFAAVGGRWSLTHRICTDTPSKSEKCLAYANLLLDRFGLVSRQTPGVDAFPGGFSALYPALRALEQAGRVWRGHFVEMIAGPLFALPQAVEQMRTFRDAGQPPDVIVLAADDPAQAYGSWLPWPAAASGLALRRMPGSAIVLAGGELALILDASGQRLDLFGPCQAAPSFLSTAFGALRKFLLRARRRCLRLTFIDGIAALQSPSVGPLREIGFRADFRGLELEL